MKSSTTEYFFRYFLLSFVHRFCGWVKKFLFLFDRNFQRILKSLASEISLVNFDESFQLKTLFYYGLPASFLEIFRIFLSFCCFFSNSHRKICFFFHFATNLRFASPLAAIAKPKNSINATRSALIMMRNGMMIFNASTCLCRRLIEHVQRLWFMAFDGGMFVNDLKSVLEGFCFVICHVILSYFEKEYIGDWRMFLSTLGDR